MAFAVPFSRRTHECNFFVLSARFTIGFEIFFRLTVKEADRINAARWNRLRYDVTTQQASRFVVQEPFTAIFALHFDDFDKIECEKRYKSH